MRIGIVDDAVLFREGLAHLLEGAGFEVVFQAGDTRGLIQEVDSASPDAVILDIRMPPTMTNEGVVAARELRERYPGVAVLLLSQHVDARDAVHLLESGGNMVGYLLKDRVTDVSELTDALQRLGRGTPVIDPGVVSELLLRRRNEDTLMTLTEREREVLGLMAEGRSNGAIEKKLFLGQKTVETHISNIFGKLSLESQPDDHRRVLAVLSYLRST